MRVYPLEIVSDAKGNVLRVLLNNGETWQLKGKCLRCGNCCKKRTCEHYSREILNGINVATCVAQLKGIKPWFCQIYPDNPMVKLIDGCGYSWEKI